MQEKIKRGFLEDFRTGLELGTTAMFDAVRWLVRKALFMPDNQTFTPLGMQRKYQDEIASAEVYLKFAWVSMLELPCFCSIRKAANSL